MQMRNAKEYIPSAAGLGVGSEGAAGEKNMHDAEFTCALFRFIQLTCEGHNLGEDFSRFAPIILCLTNTFGPQNGRITCERRPETRRR